MRLLDEIRAEMKTAAYLHMVATARAAGEPRVLDDCRDAAKRGESWAMNLTADTAGPEMAPKHAEAEAKASRQLGWLEGTAEPDAAGLAWLGNVEQSHEHAEEYFRGIVERDDRALAQLRGLVDATDRIEQIGELATTINIRMRQRAAAADLLSQTEADLAIVRAAMARGKEVAK